MIQILLHNLKMDPLVSLHYYAPVCALINVIFLPFTEGLAPFYELQKIGAAILLSNASVAFLLNVAAVFLVGVASGLVLTLAGVFKVSLRSTNLTHKGCSCFCFQRCLLSLPLLVLFRTRLLPLSPHTALIVVHDF